MMHPGIQLKTSIVIQAIRVWILIYYSSLQMKECELKKPDDNGAVTNSSHETYIKYKYRLQYLETKFQTSVQTVKHFTL